jgi:hypothetical protein
MVIVAKVSFPRRHLNQAVTVYTGLPPLPAGVTLSGPYFRPDADLVHAVSVYHFAFESQADALQLVNKRYRGFQDIPGFAKEIEAWHEYREMLAAWFN